MEDIINLCEYILEIYCELELLELQCKNDEYNFKNLVIQLNKYIFLERKLIGDLVKEYGYFYDKITDMVLNNGDIDDSIRKRIYDGITLYKLLYDERVSSNSFEYRLNKLYSSCFKNMYLMYFSFLQEFINNEKNSKIKELLLELKYYDTFFNHDMESVLVLNNFNISVDNYVDLDIVSQVANLSNGMNEVIASYVDIILGIVFEMLDVKDNDYNDNRELICLVKNQCMFRACLSLISEDEYKMISEEIRKIVNSKMNDDNKNSVILIDSIINMRNKDRERVRRLSLGNMKFD